MTTVSDEEVTCSRTIHVFFFLHKIQFFNFIHQCLTKYEKNEKYMKRKKETASDLIFKFFTCCILKSERAIRKCQRQPHC